MLSVLASNVLLKDCVGGVCDPDSPESTICKMTMPTKWTMSPAKNGQSGD